MRGEWAFRGGDSMEYPAVYGEYVYVIAEIMQA
jgi:hypothetical protein